MKTVYVTFIHEGKTYSGTLGFVPGASEICWYLTIDKYYWGRLRKANGKWMFDTVKGHDSMAKLADIFGAYVEVEVS